VLQAFALVLWLCAALFLLACTGAKTPAADAPTTLDLRDSGLTDISDLVKQTQLTHLDLRGNELSRESFDRLKTALPSCEILWSVPIGGSRFDSDSAALSLDQYNEELPEMLAYFPALTSVTIHTPPDTAAAETLTARYPSLTFYWDVTIAGSAYPADTQMLDLSGSTPDLAALKTELSQLPNLTQVVFGEETFALSDQLALAKAYPNVAFVWDVQLLDDLSVRSDTAELDLREYKVPDAAAFSEKLALFPNLTRLDLCGTGPSDDEMANMRAAYPAIKFIWLTRVYNWVIRTDIKGFSCGQRRKFPDGAGYYDSDNFSYKRIRSKDFENLKYCTDLVALDVGHCSKIGDIDFIANLPKLRILDISLCDLTDISVLETQPDLEFLELNYNYVTDISVIATLKKMKYLNLNNNNITSYDALLDLPLLERLWISCSGLTDRQLEEMNDALLAKLPNLTIKASNENKEFAMSYWRKDNPAYLEMQALFGLRAQNQGTKKD
jgi:Leucine-rich repeat (LRR) protein